MVNHDVCCSWQAVVCVVGTSLRDSSAQGLLIGVVEWGSLDCSRWQALNDIGEDGSGAP